MSEGNEAVGEYGDVVLRVTSAVPGKPAVEASSIEVPGAGWIWIDIIADPDQADSLMLLATHMGFDSMAMRDAIEDQDLPKVDDLDDHLVIVLHGLKDTQIQTYEVDCFVTPRHLVTIHESDSLAIDALWEHMQRSAELASGGPDEVLARLADVLTRRLMSVLEVFDDNIDALVADALAAEATVLGDLMAIRADLSTVRRVVHPQREVLDTLRTTTSPIITAGGRRRFSDVFDRASRAAQGLDAARSALAETLDAYRGAEARKATEVTKVLTVYAAIMLPLSLIAGIFGMNFANLPLLARDDGWIIVAAAMAFITVVSLGMFVAVGWIKRPSGREAGSTLGRGLVEAARTPAQVVGALFEVAKLPIRTTTSLAAKGLQATSGRRPWPSSKDSDDDES